ncbi:MAG: glycerol-3-phosphate dehydrogenase [Oceanicoccus sp.]|jgi:glycerol-3-phosphate dehydrogenase
MTAQSITVDIAIVGGGIAGLWLLNRLCNAGYHAVLFEQTELGGMQTIASQGMIHGGIKYALAGSLTGASEAIADMPDLWRRCLKGQGDVDLSNAKVLSDHFYMWSSQSITSKVTSFFASKITRGRVENVSKADRPPVFQDSAFKGSLYKLVDLVLDVPSVVTTLANNMRGRVLKIDWQHSQFNRDSKGNVESLLASDGEHSVNIKAQRFVFTAGEGNEQLCQALDIKQPVMQRRPLKQVLVKHNFPHPIYAHCMGSNPSPRLTVSSHHTEDGNTVWYLGGDLATDGHTMTDEALIAKAKIELADLFPWLDFSDSEWVTLYIDRAEPKQKGLIKPDKAFAANAGNCNNVIVGWPTKLTLAPNMADEIIALLDGDHIKPQADQSQLPALNCPQVASPCWETLFAKA